MADAFIKNDNAKEQADMDLEQAMKDDLIDYYRAKKSLIPVSPLTDEHDASLLEVYVQPIICSVGNNFRLGNTITREETEINKIVSYRELFYRSCKDLYVSAGAGMGKTSFCKHLAMTWCQAHRPIPEDKDAYKEQDIEAVEKFDFLFLVHLRNYRGTELCDVDDMIWDMISSNLARYLEFDKKLVSQVLHRRSCLIILDGIDEWTHPEKCCKKRDDKHPPHCRARQHCTVLTTTRPWKLGLLGISQTKTTEVFEICEFDEQRSSRLETNVLAVLKKRNNDLPKQPKSIAEFEKMLDKFSFGQIRRIPYVDLLLFDLWCEGRSIGKSQCDLFFNVLELIFERSTKKGVKLPSFERNSKDRIPVYMETKQFCNKYFSLLMTAGKLAFYSFFKHPKESSVVFDEEIIKMYLEPTEIDYFLHTGLLSQTKDKTRVAKVQHQTFFQHKSLQEFLAALYLSGSWNSKEVQDLVFSMCTTIEKVLAVPKVMLYVSGLCPEVFTEINLQWKSILEKDDFAVSYRDKFSLRNMYADYMISYQDMQIKCFKELKNNCEGHTEGFVFALADIIGLNFDEDDMNALKELYVRNKAYIRSLYLADFNNGRDYEWIQDLRQSKLQSLHLDSVNVPMLYINAECLSHCTLKHLKLSHRSLQNLFDSLSKAIKLKTLEILNISCAHHNNGCKVFILDLSNHTSLKKLYIKLSVQCTLLGRSTFEKDMSRGEQSTGCTPD